MKFLKGNINIDLKIIFMIGIATVTLLFSKSNIEYLLYFKFSQQVLYLCIIIISIALLLYDKKYYLDSISIFLMGRLIIYLLPLLFTDILEGYLGNYFSVIASFFAYFIASQEHKKDISKYINRTFFVFAIGIFLQVSYLFAMLKLQPGSLNVQLTKYYMVTPLGGSNYIACVVLPLIIFILYSNINIKLKYTATIIGIITLLFIQSKNAIFILILFATVKVFFVFSNKVNKLTIISNRKKISTLLYFLIAVLLVIIVVFLFLFFINKWNMGMNYNPNSLYEILNALTSNRLKIYIDELQRWTNHIFLGNGLGYKEVMYKSHNWIIDLLVQSGIVGLIAFISAITIWYKKIAMYVIKSNIVKGCLYGCTTILIQGFAEVSLFTITIDILFWYMMGLAISEINYIKEKESFKELILIETNK